MHKKKIDAMPHRRLRCFVRGLSHFLVCLMFRLRYEGLEHIPKQGPAILIANHTSIMDMFAVHIRVGPWIHWVAKKELYRHPWISRLLYHLGCIPVNRGKADLSAVRGIMGALSQKQIVGMFPQGTRVRPGRINEAKPRSGAAHFALKTGVPLLPVAIDGQFRLFGRIRVVFGRPFTLSRTDIGLDGGLNMDQLSCHLMQRVYDLIDIKDVYSPMQEAGEK